MSNIDKTLLSGSMGTMLLKLLSEKDMYGYEMIETLRLRSQHALESKNYLTSYEQEGVGKMRKYYSITDDGRKFLKTKLDEWETYSVAVANVLAYAV